MKAALDVSIIIVNYNTKELTRNCLRSVFEQTKDIRFEVIVSDNGSSDGSVEMIREEFPQVVLLENGENLGFGRANNRGLKIARGKYVFYLNSDTVLLNNAVKLFFDYWENSPEKEKIGALGCVLQDEDGNAIHSGGRFPTYRKICCEMLCAVIINYTKYVLQILHLNRWAQKYRKKNTKVDVSAGQIDYVTGADLFMLNNAFAIFDERFTMYYEETDMLLNLYNKMRLYCQLLDEPKIIHLIHKRKTDTITFENFSSYHNKLSSILYFRKNNKANKTKILLFLIKLIFNLPINKIYLRKLKSDLQYL